MQNINDIPTINPSDINDNYALHPAASTLAQAKNVTYAEMDYDSDSLLRQAAESVWGAQTYQGALEDKLSFETIKKINHLHAESKDLQESVAYTRALEHLARKLTHTGKDDIIPGIDPKFFHESLLPKRRITPVAYLSSYASHQQRDMGIQIAIALACDIAAAKDMSEDNPIFNLPSHSPMLWTDDTHQTPSYIGEVIANPVINLRHYFYDQIIFNNFFQRITTPRMTIAEREFLEAYLRDEDTPMHYRALRNAVKTWWT